MKREELMLGILTDELESYGDGLISAELALAIVKKVFAGEIPEENISPVDKGEAELTDEDLANASKSVLSQCCKIRCKLIPDLVTATDLQYNAFQKFEMPNPDLDQEWRFCPICGTEWTKDCEQFGCWSCGKYSALRNHVPDVRKEVDQMTAQELKEIFNANAHEWVNNGYTNTRCMNMDEFVRTTYKMFQDRKVEIPSEEDVDKEFPITSQTKAVTLSYQANQMAKREGAKWAIEQIKHLNKL